MPAIKSKKPAKKVEVEVVPASDAPMQAAQSPAIWKPFEQSLAEVVDEAKAIVVTDDSQIGLMKRAKEIRLTLRDLRVSLDSKRKELTEYHLRMKQRIDGEAKVIRDAIESLEKHLKEQEDYTLLKQQARREEVERERKLAVAHFGEVSTTIDYASMSDEDFDKYLSDLEAAAELRKKKEQEEREEKDRLRKENEELRRKQQEAEAEAARLREEQEQAEREEKERIAKEKDAERKLKSAPDREKLIAFAGSIRSLPFPELSEDAAKTGREVEEKVAKFAKWIEAEAMFL